MESLFFNITDTNYKVTHLLKLNREMVKRVDISNGIVFFQTNLEDRGYKIELKNIDRMLIFIVVEKGSVIINERSLNQKEKITSSEIGVFVSSYQDMSIYAYGSRAVLIFVADFLLKRYLSYKKYEPIDFIYNTLQKDIALKVVSKSRLDAISLYIINTLLDISIDKPMPSIRAEHKILEFIIHRLSLLNIHKPKLSSENYILANRAKDILLKEYINPPSIKELAHRCATNETKLKKIFKIVHQHTIREYIQKLRLEEANLLLREENLTIGEIAKRVGYKHQGYFSKLFFKTYGVYPVALLKKSFFSS